VILQRSFPVCIRVDKGKAEPYFPTYGVTACGVVSSVPKELQMITFRQNRRATGLAQTGYTMDVVRKDGDHATPLVPEEEFKVLRPHQLKAMEMEGRFIEINFPPRDGKTLCQAARGVRESIASGWKQKQLAVVPQNLIGNGFRHSRFVIGVKKWEWKVAEADDICRADDNSADYKRQRLTTFLKRTGIFAPLSGSGHTHTTVTGLNCVVSTMAFCLYWKYRDNGEPRTEKEQVALIQSALFRHISLWLDEAHHVRGARELASGSQKEDPDNILGSFVSHAAHHGHDSLNIVLATATPYNSTTMLDAETKLKFKSIKRTFSDYLETVATEIKTAVVKPVEYDESPIDALANEIKNAGANRFHLVFIPQDGSFWRRKKETSASQVVHDLRSTLKRVAPWARVLDATTSSGGDVLTTMQGGSTFQEQFNIVVSCRRGREGLDWLPADFLHVLFLSKQLWEANQIFTRPFSAYPGKKRVDVRYYLSATKDTVERFDTLVVTMRHTLEQMSMMSPDPRTAKIPDGRRRQLLTALIDKLGKGYVWPAVVSAPIDTNSAKTPSDVPPVGGWPMDLVETEDTDEQAFLRHKFAILITGNFDHEDAHTDAAYQEAVRIYRASDHDLLKLGKEKLDELRDESEKHWMKMYNAYKSTVR
jgi:hypothetical protein